MLLGIFVRVDVAVYEKRTAASCSLKRWMPSSILRIVFSEGFR